MRAVTDDKAKVRQRLLSGLAADTIYAFICCQDTESPKCQPFLRLLPVKGDRYRLSYPSVQQLLSFFALGISYRLIENISCPRKT